MSTATNEPEALREHIRKDLDILDADELRQLHQMIARMAAQKAARFADIDWEERGITRDLIKKEVENYRKSLHNKRNYL